MAVTLKSPADIQAMREAGKLGDQHKVPRVLNDRAVVEALLAATGAQGREPLVHSVGS